MKIEPLPAGDVGSDLLNQPVNERMLEQLLAGEWQVRGPRGQHARCSSGTSEESAMFPYVIEAIFIQQEMTDTT